MKQPDPQPAHLGRPPAAKQSPPANLANPNPASVSPYRLLGILDPDRERMVAFAMKVPTDWQVQQSFQRRWEGAVAQHQIYISLRSPDGRSQIEYLPLARYSYADGPMSNNLRAQSRSFGMPAQMAPNELRPMPPVAYIRHHLLPYLAQNGAMLRDVGNEQAAPENRDDSGQLHLRGSVDGTLPNGNKARVECRITVRSQQLNSDMFHSWSVVPSITQTAGDLEAIHTHTRVAQDSIVMNPAWQQLEQEAQARGQQVNSDASRQQHEATMAQIHANTAAMTRGHEQRMNNIRQFGEANTARFNERMTQMDRDKAAFDSRMTQMDRDKAAFDSRMADQDREQRIRVDTIRGESRYEDPTTGERVKVEDGYNHVYRSRQEPNVYYGTDTPINAYELDWQKLQKVELKDY